MSVKSVALTGSVLLFCGAIVAADDEVPNMEFLEYLGMWEESDEEWQMFDAPTDTGKDERSDPVPEGKESAENDDEN